ncbi:MAG: hypothetical protein RSC78_06030 [Acidaminococcaceae bacterium]
MNKELYDLIKPIADSLRSQSIQPAQEVEQPKRTAKPKQVVTKAEQPAPVVEAETEQPAVDPQPEERPTTTGSKEYTEEDVRAAMDRTRRRIEGESYKEKTDSEGYKKWHRALTAYFKETAAECGAEKPSTLPDSDSRQKFIDRCDLVRIENEEITDCPQ